MSRILKNTAGTNAVEAAKEQRGGGGRGYARE